MESIRYTNKYFRVTKTHFKKSITCEICGSKISSNLGLHKRTTKCKLALEKLKT